MRNNYEPASAVTVRRSVLERPADVRHTAPAAAGQSNRRMVSPENTLHAQVRNLRMALSDLTIQVSNLAAKAERV
jgi:hypothetical protein